VTWRDGVHLTGTPIWCDARRRRDVCFVSSADRVGRAGHGQLIGSPITLALVAPEESGAGHLAVPMHKPFTLGTLRLGLIPSGRCLGAAALHVQSATGSVLYAGSVRTRGPNGAEVRACDALVVGAPYGKDHHKFAKLDDVVSQLITWIKRQQKTPVLVVDTALDGIEVAQRLIAEDVVVTASRAIRDTLARVAPLVPALRDLTIRAPGKEPAVILRVDGDRTKLPENSTVAFVSGRALDLKADAGFAWPFVADRDDLLEWIAQAKAKEIFVTGASAEAIVEKLGGKARVIGPPRQMALFG
jgi:putative mRNA 3-end processing factor